jgi:SPP1 family predicted phage head-tail adaptor
MIGQLKYRAKIEKLQKVDNGRGGWTTTPQDLGEIWIAQYRITTRQQIDFRKNDLKADIKFIARSNESIDDQCRLIVNGKTYHVETVEMPIDQTDFMEIYAVGD